MNTVKKKMIWGLLILSLIMTATPATFSSMAATKPTLPEYTSAEEFMSAPRIEAWASLEDKESSEITITAPEDGCLVFEIKQTGKWFGTMSIYEGDGKSQTPADMAYRDDFGKNYVNASSAYTGLLDSELYYPCSKGESLTFVYTGTGSGQCPARIWAGFIPMTKFMKVQKVTTDGKPTIEFTCNAGEATAAAAMGSMTASEYRATGDRLAMKTKSSGLSVTIDTDTSTTFRVRHENSGYITICLLTGKPSELTGDAEARRKEELKKKPDMPLSALVGTNVVVGMTHPDAIVHISCSGKEYTSLAGSNGCYRVIVPIMTSKTKLQIWTVTEGVKSKKLTIRPESQK